MKRTRPIVGAAHMKPHRPQKFERTDPHKHVHFHEETDVQDMMMAIGAVVLVLAIGAIAVFLR